MRVRAKRDINHAELRAAFRTAGCTVHDTGAVGDGFPDLVVGLLGRSHIVEVKSPGGQLTVDQVTFKDDWRGDYFVVESLDDVIALVKMWRRWFT